VLNINPRFLSTNFVGITLNAVPGIESEEKWEEQREEKGAAV
jgi:hypothetical protein